MITGSIVTYNNSKSEIRNVISSFLSCKEKVKLFIVDNSKKNSLKTLCNDERIEYIFNNANLGYGAAHNIAFKKAFSIASEYHIVINPDITFEFSVIDSLYKKVKNNSSIGLITPKILYPNGQTQFLCKLIPTPYNLIIRRFIPFIKIKEKINFKYELKFFDYNSEAKVPILSGCFMFLNTEILKKVNGFDERFFMYMEDVDLSRRISEISDVVFYPSCSIIHTYKKESYYNWKLLIYHLFSAIKYFNKWGWFFDSKRNKVNSETLENLNYKKI